MNSTTSLISTVNSLQNELNTDKFLKSIFPEVGDEMYQFNGVEYRYISSGGTRDVYVHPDLSHVIKVANSGFLGNKFNAIEVYDYIYNLHDSSLPRVKTEFVGWKNTDLIIKQDFLIVFNTGRATINPIFSEVFTPEWSNVNDVYGYQYGWNRKTQRIEIYDTSDAYLGANFIDWVFDSNFKYGHVTHEDCFNYSRMARQLDYTNKFISHLKKHNVYDNIFTQYSKKPWCYLEHQDGILVYVNSDNTGDDMYFVKLCGDAIEFFNGKLDSLIQEFMETYKYDETKLFDI